jgi:hypothetical protein
VVAFGTGTGLVGAAEAASGKLLFSSESGARYIMGLAAAPDGKWIYTSGPDRRLQKWNCATGTATTVSDSNSLSRTMVAGRKGESLIAFMSDQVQRWDLASGSGSGSFRTGISTVKALSQYGEQALWLDRNNRTFAGIKFKGDFAW